MGQCFFCQKDIISDYGKRFCSRSCAASYNNNRRKHSIATKEKISQTLKVKIAKGHLAKPIPPKRYKHHTKILIRECSFCKEEFVTYSKPQRLCCSDECKIAIISQNNVRKKHIKFLNPYQGWVDLHSQWEVDVANFLVESHILWLRPRRRLSWIDSAKTKRLYLPDFHLPQVNLYLDVKNPLGISQQQEKIAEVSKVVKLFVGNVEEIKRMVTSVGIEPTPFPFEAERSNPLSYEAIEK